MAEQSEPAEALEALRGLDELTAPQLVALDVYLNQWVMVVLLRPKDREGVLEVQELCELAQDLTPNTTEAQAFRTRWKAFGDLLEGKRHALQVEAVEVPVKLLHEDAILERASEGPCKQSELVAALKLSAGRVSQLLGTLEAQGKIVRQRKGKDSWVSLPAAEARGARAAEAASTGPGSVANTFFGLRRAA
ncbi:hypothetical protein EEB15_13510 [Ramlibacter sp. WS9]|nr:hypothetical protein EEB15_13510 [Ramlibacter sp. WS9]